MSSLGFLLAGQPLQHHQALLIFLHQQNEQQEHSVPAMNMSVRK